MLFEDEYLQGAIAPDILAANERSYDQRLAASRMVESLDSLGPAEK
jgi:ATP-dependent DNA helicase RecG